MNNGNGKIRIAGLWRKEGKGGEAYYSGKFGYGATLLLFKNGYKTDEKDPDLILYVTKSEQKKPKQPQFEDQPDSEIPF